MSENPVVAAWRSIPPLARDLLVAFLVIVVLLGGLWAYTGQPVGSAPLVVVESGSMMHPDASYGRLGTIDPGDLILVRDVDADEAADDVVTRYGAMSQANEGRPGEGGREGYGHPGDVIIFDQVECQSQVEQDRIERGEMAAPPPIIHRAVTWVEVHGDGTFSYHDQDGVWRERESSVDLPEARLDKDTFDVSGWVTQGDNPATNPQADQAGICRDLLVAPDWLVGKARGEIPWLGLLKFMVAGNNVRNPPPDWCVVMNARAPCDLFTMLWITIGVIIAIPLAWDLSSRFLRKDGGEGGEGGTPDDAGVEVHKGPKGPAKAPERPVEEDPSPTPGDQPERDDDPYGDDDQDVVKKMGP